MTKKRRKLSNNQVDLIRADTRPQSELAEIYGCSQTLINQIKNPFPTEIVAEYIQMQIARSIRSQLSLSRLYELPKHVVTQIRDSYRNGTNEPPLSLEAIAALRLTEDLSHLPRAAVRYLRGAPPVAQAPPVPLSAQGKKRQRREQKLSEKQKTAIKADPRPAHIVAEELGLRTPWPVHELRGEIHE